MPSFITLEASLTLLFLRSTYCVPFSPLVTASSALFTFQVPFFSSIFPFQALVVEIFLTFALQILSFALFSIYQLRLPSTLPLSFLLFLFLLTSCVPFHFISFSYPATPSVLFFISQSFLFFHTLTVYARVPLVYELLKVLSPTFLSLWQFILLKRIEELVIHRLGSVSKAFAWEKHEVIF